MTSVCLKHFAMGMSDNVCHGDTWDFENMMNNDGLTDSAAGRFCCQYMQ